MKEEENRIQAPKKRGTVWFCLYAAVLAVLYVTLLGDIPIYAISNAVHDDLLMVEIAEEIIGGPDYHVSVLSKGWAYPLFLRVMHKLGLAYIPTMLGLNALVSLLAAFALRRPREPFRPFHYVLYAALLLNPALSSMQVLQRVYRNGFSTMLAFVVIVAMIAVYLRRYESPRTWIVWIAGMCAALPLFWHSREDAFWLVPFMIGVAAVTVGSALVCGRKRRAVLILAAMLMPVACLSASTQVQRALNEKRYGMPIVNELSEGEFPRVMRAIYAVDMDEPTYVSASREKIRLLYDYSPTLQSMQSALEIYLDSGANFARLEENRINGETENGWFFWCIRDAAQTKGFCDTLPQAQAFWGKMADELEAALDSGALARRMTMPSALMPPWVKGTGERLWKALLEIPGYVASFADTQAQTMISVDDGEGSIAHFEEMTHSAALRSDQDAHYARASQAVGRQQKVAAAYQMIWPAVSFLGRLCALAYICVLMMRRQSGMLTRENTWMLAGIAGALLVLYGGVGYNHAESCNSIITLYLSSAYPLVIFFDLLAIDVLFQTAKHLKVKK